MNTHGYLGTDTGRRVPVHLIDTSPATDDHGHPVTLGIFIVARTVDTLRAGAQVKGMAAHFDPHPPRHGPTCKCAECHMEGCGGFCVLCRTDLTGHPVGCICPVCRGRTL